MYFQGGCYILKTFVIDTNVLVHDPACLKVFGNNEVVIPLPVLDELDNMKTRPDECGRNARQVVRLLDELRQHGSLSDGVKCDKSTIKVELNHRSHVPEGLSSEKTDNRIISAAIGLQTDGKEVIVVSKDINLRVKCDAVGLKAKDYEKDKLAVQPEAIYGGSETIVVPSAVIDDLFLTKSVRLDVQAYRNQFFILKSDTKGSQSAIVRHTGNGIMMPLRDSRAWGVIPRNAEQKMALDLLLDPDIKLVTLIGKAGSGKTLMAAAAGLHGVLGSHGVLGNPSALTKGSRGAYQRILISRPIQPMGRDLGYLPGDIDEKLNPWMQPIYDNLELLLGSDHHMLNMYKDEGIIQVEPLTYIRGRSIPNSFIILDEAQNLTAQEIKTVITRLGEGSKIVITGDIEQIDNPYVDFADNGLTHVVERFKDHDIAGHITLKKGERSRLATLASEIL
jgi:PhoH-like ATPase